MPLVICDHCGSEFRRKASHIAKNERQYCSRACYGLARRARETRTCPICGIAFVVKPSEEKRFCSPRCAAVALTARSLTSCKWCGKAFEHKVGESKKFCSRKCYVAWTRKDAEKHWETRKCPTCGERFRARKSEQKTCCSPTCANIYKRQRIVARCEVCSAEFEVTSSVAEKGFGRFCSWGCYNEWQRTRTGELAANWRGGRTPQVYPKTFNASFRRGIRKRDDHTCAVCRFSGNDVHHINYVKKDSTDTNCITLCKSCHAKTNADREYWSAALRQIMTARGYIHAHN